VFFAYKRASEARNPNATKLKILILHLNAQNRYSIGTAPPPTRSSAEPVQPIMRYVIRRRGMILESGYALRTLLRLGFSPGFSA